MASVQLSLRDRAALVVRALAGGVMPTDPGTVGGRIVSGVIPSGGTPPAREAKELLSAYSTQPWLRAVVSRISYDVAAQDMLLFVHRKNGKAVRTPWVRQLQKGMGASPQAVVKRQALIKAAVDAGDLEPVLDHPLLDLLSNFNPFHIGLAGRRVTQQMQDLVGEAFWLLERAQEGPLRGLPVAIWPVPPSWILGTPTLTRPFFRVSFRGWQGSIPQSEFVWFSELDPANPYGRGTGTAMALADDLETDEYAAKHAKALFYNRARPDLVVSPKSDESAMDPTEVQRLEQGWLQRAQGFWKGFKPFFLARAVDIKELDSDLRSQQFVQLREYERNTCIQTFGVSPEILGIVAGGANRATITIAEYIYGRRVLVPRLEGFRGTLQVRVVPLYDDRLILDYTSPVGRDTEQELEAMKARPEAFSMDEWRARAGEESLPDKKGELFLISPTLDRVPLEDLDLQPEPLPALPEGGLPLGGPPDPNAPPATDDDDLPLAAGWTR